ncbi:hypothetical protein Q5P01_025544 [Channa striata]|uniref:Uncharacterized protein n=1 Tax=Channa striata TaxID=64152 RepID=A0AA88IWZ6_CHASR|nr:hypothetical protein Q5P01_025544 [Channa striata]
MLHGDISVSVGSPGSGTPDHIQALIPIYILAIRTLNPQPFSHKLTSLLPKSTTFYNSVELTRKLNINQSSTKHF